MSKVGLIIPTEEEANLIYRDTLRRFAQWRVSGIGKVKAMAAAVDLIHMHHCDAILLFGFAGSLRGLQVGNIVEPNFYIEGDNDTSIIKHPYPNVVNLTEVMEHKLLDDSTMCPMISQDEFLTENPYDFKYQYMACDMEAYAVAYFCHDNLIPFRCVRVISDIVGWKDNSRAYKSAHKNLAKIMNNTLDEVSLCLT